MEIPILRQTRHFVIVNKPPLVHAQRNKPVRSKEDWEQDMSLVTQLRKRTDLFPKRPPAPFTEPKSVHRLDYSVSGAMVVATSTQAAQLFSRHLSHGGSSGWPLRKYYLALLKPFKTSPLYPPFGSSKPKLPGLILNYGPGEMPSGHIDRPLTYKDHEDPMECTTSFKVIKRMSGGKILVLLEPITGRKHQLRRHCAEVLRAPVVGDSAYGRAHRKRAGQIALHSWRLDYKAGMNWDSVTAPIIWSSDDLWKGVVDHKTGELLNDIVETLSEALETGS